MRFVAGLGRRSGRDTAGRGAVAERHREDVAGRGALARGCTVAEILLPGRPIGMKMLAGDAVAELLLAGHLRKGRGH